MSVLILPPLRDDGQKVPCEVGDSSVLYSPEDIHLEFANPPENPIHGLEIYRYYAVYTVRTDIDVRIDLGCLSFFLGGGFWFLSPDERHLLLEGSSSGMCNWLGWPDDLDKVKEQVAAYLNLEFRPQRVQLAQAGRKLPPVVTGDAAQDADYVRVRAAREGGCHRPCGNQPNLPVCTRCFVNLHAGKWTADEANGNFVFGHGVGWEKVLTICSQVHGWIKPSGVAA